MFLDRFDLEELKKRIDFVEKSVRSFFPSPLCALLVASLSRRVETRIGTHCSETRIAVFKAMIDDRENAMPKIGTRMFHVVTLDERGELTVDPGKEPTDARRTVRAA